jgi:hypothetical protein
VCFNLTFQSEDDLAAIAAGISGDSDDVAESGGDRVGTVAPTPAR